MATLSDLVRQKRRDGTSRTGSLVQSIKEKFKESIDPRQLLDQSGLLTALFPSLKAFKAGDKRDTSNNINKKTVELVSQVASFSQNTLQAISVNTEIAAKNTMVLPMMSRDMNVMRQNMQKLLKSFKVKPATKADMFFLKSAEREKSYESEFQRTGDKRSPEKTKEDSGGTFSKLAGAASGLFSFLGLFLTPLMNIFSGVFSMISSTFSNVIFALLSPIVSMIKTLFFSMSKEILKILLRIPTIVIAVLSGIKAILLTTIPFLITKALSAMGLGVTAAAGTAAILSLIPSELGGATITEFDQKVLSGKPVVPPRPRVMPGRPQSSEQKNWDRDFGADYNTDGSVKKGSELYEKTKESVKFQQEKFVEDFTTRSVQGKPVAPPRPKGIFGKSEWDEKYAKDFNQDGTIKQGTELYRLSDQSVRSRNTETLKNLDNKISGIQSVSQISSGVSQVSSPMTNMGVSQVDSAIPNIPNPTMNVGADNVQGSSIISAFSNLKNQVADVGDVEETTISKSPLKSNSIGSPQKGSMADVHDLNILRYFNMEVK
jgi:hypothetical protein